MLVQTARLCGQTTRCQLCRLLLRLPLYLPYSALRRDCCHTNAACRLFIHIGSRRRCHFAILALLSRLPEGIVCTPPPPLSLSFFFFLISLEVLSGRAHWQISKKKQDWHTLKLFRVSWTGDKRCISRHFMAVSPTASITLVYTLLLRWGIAGADIKDALSWELAWFGHVTRHDSLSKKHPSVVGRGNAEWQHPRVDIPAHARTTNEGLLQKRLEEDLCWIVPHIPPTTKSVKELNWTEQLRIQSCLRLHQPAAGQIRTGFECFCF